MYDTNTARVNAEQRQMRRCRLVHVLSLLSLAVAVFVFWQLRIVGITLTDEAACGLVGHVHTASCAQGEAPCAFEEHVHTAACFADGAVAGEAGEVAQAGEAGAAEGTVEAGAAEAGVQPEPLPKSDAEPSPLTESDTPNPGALADALAFAGAGVIPTNVLDPYIADINADGKAITGFGTVRNPDTGFYDTALRIEFRMPVATALDSLESDTGSFRYDLPAEIMLAPQLLDNSYSAYKVGDSSVHAFDYWFRVNPAVEAGAAGHYYLEAAFDPEYLHGVHTEAQVTNFVDFSCSIDADDVGGTDGIHLVFEGNYDLVIPPDAVNEHYDVTVAKSGALTASRDALRYTLTVSSAEGTPGEVVISDGLTFTGASGVVLGAPVLVSVVGLPSGEDMTAQCVLVPRAVDGEGAGAGAEAGEGEGAKAAAFDVVLPPLGAGERYVVTYEYPLTGLPDNAEFTAENAVSATTKSNLKTYGDTDVYIIRNTTVPKITKSGAQQPGGEILWEIIINPARADIAGKRVTDDAFAELVAASISVQNGNDLWSPVPADAAEYTIECDAETGAVTSIVFHAAEAAGGADGAEGEDGEDGEPATGTAPANTNCYIIRYTTTPDVAFDETEIVTNTAIFDGEPAQATALAIGGTLGKTVSAALAPDGATPGAITWTVHVALLSGGVQGGTEFEDALGVLGEDMSDDHYLTALQYTALVTALEAEPWWAYMSGLAYTTDGVTYTTEPPAPDARIIGYRFEVNADAATSVLPSTSLSWSYTTTASMESAGGAVDYPEYNPAISYYPAGTVVQWQGWVYRATHGGAAGNDPAQNFTVNEGSMSQPWLRLGPAGGAASYRSFTNTIHVGEREITVKKSFSSRVHKYHVTPAADGSYTLDEADAALYFNETSMDTALRWLVEVDAPVPATYRVVDTLPEGVRLVGLYVASAQRMQWELTPYQSNVAFTADGAPFAANTQGYAVTGTYDAQGNNVVNLSIVAAAAGKFRVLYVCELDEAYRPAAGERLTYVLGNVVTVYENDDILGEAEHTLTVITEERKVVSNKSGTLNYKRNPDGTWVLDAGGNRIWDNTITYTVDLNPRAENLLANPALDPHDTLHLQDTLTYTYTDGIGGFGEAVLVLSSVSLTDADTHESVPVEWTVRTTESGTTRASIIEGDVPDGRHLTLSYTYSVWSTMENGIVLHNDVTLEGDAFQSSEHTDRHERDEFDTHAASDYMEYQLVKVDAHTRAPLEGAEFTAYVWAPVSEGGEGEAGGTGGAGGAYAWVPLGKTYVTDTDGLVKITPLDTPAGGTEPLYVANTAYCVIETLPPAGYELDVQDRPTYCFWISSPGVGAPEHAPAGFTARAVDLSYASGRAYVENERSVVYLLPETGGVGVAWVVLGGAALVAFALGALARRARAARRS